MNRTGAIACLLMLGCAPEPQQLKIVASTANVSAVLIAIAGDRMAITVLAPGGLCPGHFDLKPSDVTAANQADLIINQGWEAWFSGLVAALDDAGQRVMTARTEGNWMLPEIHKSATAEIAELLVTLDSSGATGYRMNAAAYVRRVDSAAAAARALIVQARKPWSDQVLPSAIAAEHQAPFLRWLGLNVVATYGRPEEFTARELDRLVRIGSDSAVGLFVDNLQSGPDAGLELARSLGAEHINLTNFPVDEDYPATLLANARAIAVALETRSSRTDP